MRGWAVLRSRQPTRNLQQLIEAAAREMSDLQTTHGEVAFAAPAHIAVVQKS